MAILGAGCANRPAARHDGARVEFTNDAENPGTLTQLGGRLAIAQTAESWPKLVEKTKPTFAWNGCNLMWIETGKTGLPRFVMDQAYRYEPTNQPPQVVLLEERDAPFDEWYGEVMGNNLRGVAELQQSIPPTRGDSGERGDYAVVLSVEPGFGTVYEIGWQRLMANGSAIARMGRKLYVLRDNQGQWRFLGEGPEEGEWRGGGVGGQTRVVWRPHGAGKIPLRIEFVTENREVEAHEGDIEERPVLTEYDDWVLRGDFPAQVKRRSERSYLLTEKGDTWEKIMERLGAWESDTSFDFYEKKNPERLAYIQKVLAAWCKELQRLNSRLPRGGTLREGMRVDLLTYDEREVMVKRQGPLQR